MLQPRKEIRSLLHVFILKIFVFNKAFPKYKKQEDKIYSLKRIIKYKETFISRITILANFLDPYDVLLRMIINDVPILETELVEWKDLLKELEYDN